MPIHTARPTPTVRSAIQCPSSTRAIRSSVISHQLSSNSETPLKSSPQIRSTLHSQTTLHTHNPPLPKLQNPLLPLAPISSPPSPIPPHLSITPKQQHQPPNKQPPLEYPTVLALLRLPPSCSLRTSPPRSAIFRCTSPNSRDLL